MSNERDVFRYECRARVTVLDPAGAFAAVVSDSGDDGSDLVMVETGSFAGDGAERRVPRAWLAPGWPSESAGCQIRFCLCGGFEACGVEPSDFEAEGCTCRPYHAACVGHCEAAHDKAYAAERLR
jgi:hypothetical protein